MGICRTWHGWSSRKNQRVFPAHTHWGIYECGVDCREFPASLCARENRRGALFWLEQVAWKRQENEFDDGGACPRSSENRADCRERPLYVCARRGSRVVGLGSVVGQRVWDGRRRDDVEHADVGAHQQDGTVARARLVSQVCMAHVFYRKGMVIEGYHA